MHQIPGDGYSAYQRSLKKQKQIHTGSAIRQVPGVGRLAYLHILTHIYAHGQAYAKFHGAGYDVPASTGSIDLFALCGWIPESWNLEVRIEA